MSIASQLAQKIEKKIARVAIIGLGYVGLPTAVAVAKAGFEVCGIDIKKERVDLANRGKSYIGDVSSKDLVELIKTGRFRAFHTHDPLKYSDIVLICVPTPLDSHKIPDLTYIQKTSENIARYAHRGQLVILESSTYPGTTREVILPLLEKGGRKVGKDFFLVFSPERIDPGNKKYPLEKIPRVTGGITKQCTTLAVQFYQSILEVPVIAVSSPEIAEMTKLLENTYRLVNISLVNELALLAGKMGIDIWEVIEAAKTKPYGFSAFYPSPKSGGHCIPLDPFYLSWKARQHNFWARFIELAGEINEQMPHFVVTKVISVLNQYKKPIKGSKILIWGVAYKRDIPDTRESAAHHVIWDLLRKGAYVDYFDPYAKTFRLDHYLLKEPHILRSVSFPPKNLEKYDCVVILTDHSGFDYEKIAENMRLVVDTRNAIKSRHHSHVFHL